MISHASWLATGLALLALLSVSTVKFLLSTTRPRNFPPGPPTRLGLGNAHQIPKKQPFLQFLAWSKTYGDVLGLKAGPENIVVLSSPEAVHELFSLRGAVYSGRPDRVIPANYVYRGHIGAHVLSMQNNASLRRFRATISSATSGTGSMSAVLSVQNAKAAALVHDILMKPSDFPMHIACWIIDLALRVVTGQRLEDRGMAFVQRIIGKSSKLTPLMNPGMIHPVERMPLLRLVPEVLSTWKQNARTARQYMTEEYAGFFQTAKELSISRITEAKREIGDVAKNNKKGFCNIMTTMIEENSQKEASKRWTDEEMAWSGGSTFDAAIGTSQAAIMIFILHVAAHPDVQAKIHEELDRVCGDRPPGVETFQKLPYLRASVLETFRICATAPLGLGHRVDRDDEFRGYTIPKGTTVITNLYALGHDPNHYDRPDEFIPERYLHDPHGLKPGCKISQGARRFAHVFGAGRRVCPGEQFSQNTILLTASKLLWAFDIAPAEGEKLDTAIDTAFETGLASRPKPFRVDFRLRDESRRDGVETDFQTSAAELN